MWKLVNSSIIGVYWSFQAFESKLVSKRKENIKKSGQSGVSQKSKNPNMDIMYSDLICTSISSIEILVFHVIILTICDTHFSAHNTTLILEIWAELCMNYINKNCDFYDTQYFVLIRVSQKGHKDVTECWMTVFRISWEKMPNFLKFNLV